MKNTVLILSLVLSSCKIGTPFKGPRYINKEVVSSKDSVYVGITEVTLKKEDDVFWDFVKAINDTIEKYPGFIGYSIRQEIFGEMAWTLTVWDDKESMKNFIYSKLHIDAMEKGWSAVKRGRFSKFMLPKDSIPLDWKTAQEYLNNNFYEIPHYE
jgi:heme-degrading monooxygenase HmoA